MDVDKLLRLKGLIAQAAEVPTGGRSRSAAMVDSWRRIRDEVRSAIDEDLREEFDRLFPEGFRVHSAGAEAETDRAAIAQRNFIELGGWLQGEIEALTLDRVIAAKARAEVEQGKVGFQPDRG